MMKNIALITGASTGIGRELAFIHAEAGDELILVAIDSLEEVRDQLVEEYSAQVTTLQLDLATYAGVQCVVAAINELDRPLTYLVNNAGFGGAGFFHQRDIETDLKMMDLNMRAHVAITHAALPRMIRQGKGAILNTCSMCSFMPGPLQTVYFSTKAFLLSFSLGLREELSDSGISVTALCPGPVDTAFESRSQLSGTHMFGQGVKPLSARQVAHQGYAGMRRGKAVVVPGRMNRLVAALVTRMLPRTTLARMARKLGEPRPLLQPAKQ